MRVIPLTMVVMLIAMAGFPIAANAATAKPEPLPKNEFVAKAPANYLALPRFHMAVVVDANREFRELELEVWLVPKDEDNLALVRSAKKGIMAGLQDDFSAYDWEAFKDPDKGPQIAKQIVAATVERVSGGKLSDVLIKSLILH